MSELGQLILCALLVFVPCAGSSQARERGPTAVRAGQVMEQIAPASIILSSAHYQSTLALSCAGINCFGSFPSPGAHHRLRITRMSCLLTGDPSSAFGLGYMRLEKADDSLLQLEFLPVDYSAPDGSHTLNRDVDMQVGANQHIYVQLALGTGSAGNGVCFSSGIIETLQ